MNGSFSKICQMLDFDDFVTPRVFLTDFKTNYFPNNMFLHPNVFCTLPFRLHLYYRAVSMRNEDCRFFWRNYDPVHYSASSSYSVFVFKHACISRGNVDCIILRFWLLLYTTAPCLSLTHNCWSPQKHLLTYFFSFQECYLSFPSLFFLVQHGSFQ